MSLKAWQELFLKRLADLQGFRPGYLFRINASLFQFLKMTFYSFSPMRLSFYENGNELKVFFF
jgi:hypothetical protein